MLVCSKRPLELDRLPEAIRRHNEFGGQRLQHKELAFLKQTGGGLVLTDDYAPVEICSHRQ